MYARRDREWLEWWVRKTSLSSWVLNELPFWVSGKSHGGNAFGVAPRWRTERNRFDPMRNAGYIGKLVRACVCSRTARGLLALISFAINLCVVSRYIYEYICIYVHFARRNVNAEKVRCYSGYLTFHSAVIPPVRGRFCFCAQLHVDCILNGKRQRIH